MTEAAPADDRLPIAAVSARGGDRRRTPPPPAQVDPIAQVLVDVPLAHLDRPFEYVVPAPMAATAVPGARVRVRFA